MGAPRSARSRVTTAGNAAANVSTSSSVVDHPTLTRSDSKAPTSNADQLANRAGALLDKPAARSRPVRLLGAGVHGLVDPADMASHDTDELRLPFDDPGEQT